MRNGLKSCLSILLVITIIFSSVYVGLNEVDFSRFFGFKAYAVSDSVLTFAENEDGKSCSIIDCSNLASGELIIPDTYNGLSVTKIGDNAFYFCNSLTSITIPNSVTSIGNSAFEYCKNLSTIIIPDSVLSIGDYAFMDCKSLSSITIPNSVTSIGEWAFESCKNLTSVTISNSVSIISTGVFSSCENLVSIEIPDSVTSIGDEAFSLCENLVSVEIPDSVTSIGDFAFAYCENLIAVIIPSSVMNIGEEAFYGCNTEKLVLYCEQGSYAESWAKDNGYNYSITKFTKTSENFIIRVVDSNGNSVENADVVIKQGNIEVGSYVTNDSGFAIHFGEVALSDVSFTVSADGYVTYYSEDTGEVDNSYNSVVLYKENETKFRLKGVYYYLSDKNYEEKTLKRNLITGSKEVSQSYLGDKYFVLECTPYENTEIETYTLFQDNKEIVSNNEGVFNLNLSSFEVGGNIYILTSDSTGRKEKTPINLDVCEDLNKEEYKLEFSDKITFKVPDNAPLIGGTECSYEIPDLPVEFAIEDGKIYVGINLNLYKNSTNDKEDSFKPETPAEKIRKFEKQINDYYNDTAPEWCNTAQLFHEKYDELLFLLRDRNVMSLPGIGEFEIAFCGSGEAEFSESLDNITINLYLIGKAKVEKQIQMVVQVVPVTIEFGVGVEAQLHGEGSYDFDAKTMNGDIKFEITPEFEVFGGVGVSKIVAVGAYGTAKLPIEIQLIGTTVPSGLNKVDFVPELGFKAYAGPFEYSQNFIGQMWTLYPESSTEEASLTSISDDASTYFAPYVLSNYSVQATTYLSEQSVWLGACLGEDLSSPTPLWEDTYRNCQPKIISNDTATILTFIGADTSKGDGNTATAMYSILDEEGKWVSPVRFDSDETFDTALSVCSCDEDIFAVYQNTTVSFDETVDKATYINNQAISVYKYDSSSNSFVIDTTFVNTGNYYRLPKVTVVNDVPTVTWISSNESDFFGQGTNNTLYYSQFDGEKWSDPQIFAENINTVMDYTVGEVDGNFVALLTLDSDNDLSTSDTNVVYYENGSSTIILEGDTTDLQFEKLPSESEETFVFVNDGKLYSFNGTELNEIYAGIGAPESVEILSDKILLTLSGDNCSNIYSLNYDSSLGSYGFPFALTNQDKNRYIEKLTVTEIDGKQIVAMVNKDVTVATDSVTDVCDLSVMYLDAISDIVISAISYDKESAVPGCATAIDTGIRNYGSDTVTALTITVADEAGTVIVEKEVEVSIQPGEEILYTLYFELPEDSSSSTFTVTAVETGNDEDANLEDNSYEVDFGYSDLELGYEIQKIGSLNSIVISVMNKGTVATTGQLEVYFNGSETPYQTFDLSELSSYETEAFYIDITSENLGGNTGTVSFKVTGENKEFYTHNNSDSVYIDITPSIFRAVESIDILTTVDYENKYIFTSSSSIKDIEKLLFVDPDYVLSHINDSLFFGTGERFEVNDSDGLLAEDYTLIVEGDLNGDGVCDVLDAAFAQLYSEGHNEPTQNEIYAANGCISDEIDVNSYQNVVNTCLAS